MHLFNRESVVTISQSLGMAMVKINTGSGGWHDNHKKKRHRYDNRNDGLRSPYHNAGEGQDFRQQINKRSGFVAGLAVFIEFDLTDVSGFDNRLCPSFGAMADVFLFV